MKKICFASLGLIVVSLMSGCATRCDRCICDSWNGKKVLVLGDSITDAALHKRWKNYWAYLWIFTPRTSSLRELRTAQ